MSIKFSGSVAGPTGSGKTIASLMLAYGILKGEYPDATDDWIWSKIGVVELERGRHMHSFNKVYNGLIIKEHPYEVVLPPLSVTAIYSKIVELKRRGCLVVIVDSISPAWTGAEGSIIDRVNKTQLANPQRYNNYTVWGEKTIAAEKTLLTALARDMDVHMIFCVRAKENFQIISKAESETGKSQLLSLGLEEINQGDFRFEMDIAYMLDRDKPYEILKDTFNLFITNADRKRYIDYSDGVGIAAYLSTLGVDSEALHKQLLTQLLIGEFQSKFVEMCNTHKISPNAYIAKATTAKLKKLVDEFKKQKDEILLQQYGINAVAVEVDNAKK